MGYKTTYIDGDLALGRNAEIGGDVDIYGMTIVKRNLKVEGFLDAPNIKGALKGFFRNEDELHKEFPKPRPGWMAIVLEGESVERGFVHVVKDDAWEQVGEEAKPLELVIDSLNVYSTKTELDRTEEELLNRIQGTSENSDAVRDPFRYLGNFNSIEDLEGVLDGMMSSARNHVGIFRAVVSTRVITVVNNPISAGDHEYNQMIMGCLRIKDDGTLEQHGQSFNVLYRISYNGEWLKWNIANNKIIDEMHNTLKDSIDNEAARAKAAEEELLKRLQGVSENSNASTDPFRYLGNLSKTKFFETIDALNGDSAASREECAGHFRAAVEHRIVDVYSEQIGWANNVWVQRMVCPMQLFNEVAQKENVYTKTGVDKDGNTVYYKYRTHTYTQNFDTLTGASTNKNTVKTYTRTCNKGVWGDWKDVSNNYINSHNYGKKIAFFGGSFAQNMSLTSTPWSFDYQGRTYSLMQYIAEKLGATAFDDYAVGSQGVIVGDIPIMEQLLTAGAGYDIYVIFGGINDFGNEIPLGESNGAANDTTYCGGLKAAFDWIRSNNKSAKIYTVTPFKAYKPDDRYWNPRSNIKKNGHTFYEFIQAQKEVAQIHGVPCFDLWANQQFSGASASEHYYTDLLHPNGKGYQAVADALVEFLAYGLGSGVLDAYAVLPNATDTAKGLMSAEDKRELTKATEDIETNAKAIADEATRAKAAEEELEEQIADGAARVKANEEGIRKLKNQVDSIEPVIYNSSVTNAPDEEDLTETEGVLKLKDRAAADSKGYVILRRDGWKNQLVQSDTIYEVRYDIDLQGQSIKMPPNSVLQFAGGAMRNGELVLDDTRIVASYEAVFGPGLVVAGSTSQACNVAWFGAKATTVPTAIDDSSSAINSALKSCFNEIDFEIGYYYIGSPLYLNSLKTLRLRGNCTNPIETSWRNVVEEGFVNFTDGTVLWTDKDIDVLSIQPQYPRTGRADSYTVNVTGGAIDVSRCDNYSSTALTLYGQGRMNIYPNITTSLLYSPKKIRDVDNGSVGIRIANIPDSSLIPDKSEFSASLKVAFYGGYISSFILGFDKGIFLDILNSYDDVFVDYNMLTNMHIDLHSERCRYAIDLGSSGNSGGRLTGWVQPAELYKSADNGATCIIGNLKNLDIESYFWDLGVKKDTVTKDDNGNPITPIEYYTSQYSMEIADGQNRVPRIGKNVNIESIKGDVFNVSKAATETDWETRQILELPVSYDKRYSELVNNNLFGQRCEVKAVNCSVSTVYTEDGRTYTDDYLTSSLSVTDLVGTTITEDIVDGVSKTSKTELKDKTQESSVQLVIDGVFPKYEHMLYFFALLNGNVTRVAGFQRVVVEWYKGSELLGASERNLVDLGNVSNYQTAAMTTINAIIDKIVVTYSSPKVFVTSDGTRRDSCKIAGEGRFLKSYYDHIITRNGGKIRQGKSLFFGDMEFKVLGDKLVVGKMNYKPMPLAVFNDTEGALSITDNYPAATSVQMYNSKYDYLQVMRGELKNRYFFDYRGRRVYDLKNLRYHGTFAERPASSIVTEETVEQIDYDREDLFIEIAGVTYYRYDSETLIKMKGAKAVSGEIYKTSYESPAGEVSYVQLSATDKVELEGNIYYKLNKKIYSIGVDGTPRLEILTNLPYGYDYFCTDLYNSKSGKGVMLYYVAKDYWVDASGVRVTDAASYNALRRYTSGKFAEKPTENVPVGHAYYCTDRMTSEGGVNGIMLYYNGATWTDALGREVI